ncbi:MAG: amidohydrolase family protein [Gordonia sp. (in: high G+C Gram-positive bacteria)]
MTHTLPDTPLNGVVGATTPQGHIVDAAFDVAADGSVVVAQVTAHDPSNESAPPGWLDLRGYVVTPAGAEPHAHLDKALSWSLINPAVGDLVAAVNSWQKAAATFDENSFYDRARTAALLLLRNGTTAVRTHVDILGTPEDTSPEYSDPLRAIRAVNRLRAELGGVLTVQIVALAPPGTSAALIEDALAAGADFVGGAPHLAASPISETRALVAIAERNGVGIDLHADEFLSGDAATIEEFASLVADWPPTRIRTAGHCCRLSTLRDSELSSVAGHLASSGIGVVALPITNLYLQARGITTAAPRAIAPISALRDAGVRVAAGADNIRDPFNPVGRADPLETASLLLTAGHQTPTQAIDLVTNDARAVMGLPAAGLHPGARADLLAVRGNDLVEIIGMAPADRVVIGNGVLISRSHTTYQTSFALDSVATSR